MAETIGSEAIMGQNLPLDNLPNIFYRKDPKKPPLTYRRIGNGKTQRFIVDRLIKNEDTLAILPTSAGKTFCYQAPGCCKDGLTIVFSPITALIKDQCKNFNTHLFTTDTFIKNAPEPDQRLLKAVSIKDFGTMDEAIKRIVENNTSGINYKFFYLSPEYLGQEKFIRACSDHNLFSSGRVNMVVVDEVHCMSSWGFDFREDYLKIGEFVNRFEKRPVISAFTATVNNNDIDKICDILGLERKEAVKSFIFPRKNLQISIKEISTKTFNEDMADRILQERDNACNELLEEHELSLNNLKTLIHCPSLKEAKSVYKRLTAKEKTAKYKPYTQKQVSIFDGSSDFKKAAVVHIVPDEYADRIDDQDYDIIYESTLFPKTYLPDYLKENFEEKKKKADEDIRERLEKKYTIIYCSKINEVETIYGALCEFLSKNNKNGKDLVARYHGKLSEKAKNANFKKFMLEANECRIMVATKAFGMGIDKNNIAVVIHYGVPHSIEDYYQEIGRAGRDGYNSRCILLYTQNNIIGVKDIIEKSKNTTNSISGAVVPKLMSKEQLKSYKKLSITRFNLIETLINKSSGKDGISKVSKAIQETIISYLELKPTKDKDIDNAIKAIKECYEELSDIDNVSRVVSKPYEFHINNTRLANEIRNSGFCDEYEIPVKCFPSSNIWILTHNGESKLTSAKLTALCTDKSIEYYSVTESTSFSIGDYIVVVRNNIAEDIFKVTAKSVKNHESDPGFKIESCFSDKEPEIRFIDSDSNSHLIEARDFFADTGLKRIRLSSEVFNRIVKISKDDGCAHAFLLSSLCSGTKSKDNTLFTIKNRSVGCPYHSSNKQYKRKGIAKKNTDSLVFTLTKKNSKERRKLNKSYGDYIWKWHEEKLSEAKKSGKKKQAGKYFKFNMSDYEINANILFVKSNNRRIVKLDAENNRKLLKSINQKISGHNEPISLEKIEFLITISPENYIDKIYRYSADETTKECTSLIPVDKSNDSDILIAYNGKDTSLKNITSKIKVDSDFMSQANTDEIENLSVRPYLPWNDSNSNNDEKEISIFKVNKNTLIIGKQDLWDEFCFVKFEPLNNSPMPRSRHKEYGAEILIPKLFENYITNRKSKSITASRLKELYEDKEKPLYFFCVENYEIRDIFVCDKSKGEIRTVTRDDKIYIDGEEYPVTIYRNSTNRIVKIGSDIFGSSVERTLGEDFTDDSDFAESITDITLAGGQQSYSYTATLDREVTYFDMLVLDAIYSIVVKNNNVILVQEIIRLILGDSSYRMSHGSGDKLANHIISSIENLVNTTITIDASTSNDKVLKKKAPMLSIIRSSGGGYKYYFPVYENENLLSKTECIEKTKQLSLGGKLIKEYIPLYEYAEDIMNGEILKFPSHHMNQWETPGFVEKLLGANDLEATAKNEAKRHDPAVICLIHNLAGRFLVGNRTGRMKNIDKSKLEHLVEKYVVDNNTTRRKQKINRILDTSDAIIRGFEKPNNVTADTRKVVINNKEAENFKIKTDKDPTIPAYFKVLSQYNGTEAESDIRIPFGVQKISSKVFAGKNFITGIEIPDSVFEIGNGTFSNCKSLTTVKIPNSIALLGTKAFSGCQSLTRIALSNAIKVISGSTFSNCINLQTVTGIKSVTTIGENAFSNCKQLSSISLPECLTTIEKSAFANCENLEEITIPGSVEEISEKAFYNCKKLKKITLTDGIRVIKKDAFTGCSSLEEIVIPKSVETIEIGAFNKCGKLKAITMTKEA